MQTQGMGRMLLFISNNGQIMVKIVNNKNSDLIRQYGNFKTFKTILKQFGTFLNVTMFKRQKAYLFVVFCVGSLQLLMSQERNELWNYS